MCGILGIFGSAMNDVELRRKLIECSKRLRHRGPDWSGYLIHKNNGIAHERLAIIDPESGAQPLRSADDNIIVAANGEIYNYKELYAGLKQPYTPLTGSDCEVVIPLFLQVHAYFFYVRIPFNALSSCPRTLFLSSSLPLFRLASKGSQTCSVVCFHLSSSTVATARTTPCAITWGKPQCTLGTEPTVVYG